MKRFAAVIVTAVIVFLFVSSVRAEYLEWETTIGGATFDGGDSVQQTADGGYIIAGSTDSYGAGKSDVWLVKTNASGEELWDKTFGGANVEQGNAVQQTIDGGYIIVGYTTSYGAGDFDVWLIRTDSSGNKLWDKTFGGAGRDYGSSVEQTTDGGYVVTGYTGSFGAGNYDVWLIRTDSSGNKLWDKTFGGASADAGRCVRQTSDEGYVIAGFTSSYGAGNYDVWLIRTDSSGNKLWDKFFGGTSVDDGMGVQETADGGYVIASWTYSYGAGMFDVWLIKTDSSGERLWDKTFGGIYSDYCHDVQETADGGYIIAGRTGDYGAGTSDGWLVKTDSLGNKLWDKTFGGTGSDYCYSVQQSADCGYIITGTTYSYGAGQSDLWLIKTASENPPLIAANESALTASCIRGQNAPSQTFELWNSGSDTLFYAINDDAGWLSCSPTEGASVGEHNAVTISYSTSDLAVGEYSATIIISATCAGNYPLTLPVNLTVTRPPPVTVSFTSIAEHDGTVRESSENSSVGGDFNAGAAIPTALRMGDDFVSWTKRECQYKTVISFDTSSIPYESTILSANLKLTGGGVVGKNPLNTHGPCHVDIKNGFFGTSLLLENIDFEAPATAVQVSTMPAPAAGGTVSTGLLNDNGLISINKQGYTQMRLYFLKDDNNDDNDDYVGCYSGESSTVENRPTLEVTYQE